MKCERKTRFFLCRLNKPEHCRQFFTPCSVSVYLGSGCDLNSAVCRCGGSAAPFSPNRTGWSCGAAFNETLPSPVPPDGLEESWLNIDSLSESLKRRSGDTFINMMNAFWMGHLVLPPTESSDLWSLLRPLSENNSSGIFLDWRISAGQINDPVTQLDSCAALMTPWPRCNSE